MSISSWYLESTYSTCGRFWWELGCFVFVSIEGAFCASYFLHFNTFFFFPSFLQSKFYIDKPFSPPEWGGGDCLHIYTWGVVDHYSLFKMLCLNPEPPKLRYYKTRHLSVLNQFSAWLMIMSYELLFSTLCIFCIFLIVSSFVQLPFVGNLSYICLFLYLCNALVSFSKGTTITYYPSYDGSYRYEYWCYAI